MSNISILLIGLIATIAMDIWQWALFFVFKIPRPEWQLVGRWILGIPKLGFVQTNPQKLPSYRLEKIVGWGAHYLIGIAYAIIYVYLLKIMPLNQLTVTLFFVVVSLSVPWLFLLPCMGMGFFAANTPKPRAVMIYNLMTHLVFGMSMGFVVLCVK